MTTASAGADPSAQGEAEAQAQSQAEQAARALAQQAIAAGDPTAWFEPLYQAANAGQLRVPWDRNAPSQLLVQWAADRGLSAGEPQRSGRPRAALVVGCGLGDDAEFIAGMGFRATAFDISPSAIEAARRRFPESAVDYCVADLMAPPARWLHAFDLVIENLTLQALPERARRSATGNLAPLVAPGGTLIVLARGRPPGTEDDGPPWSLTRSEIDDIAAGELIPVRIDEITVPESTAAWRWRAEFRRES